MTSNLGERPYKSIVFEVLPAAIESERAASGRVDQRGLFYACRRLYLAHPERPLKREAYYAARKNNPEHILEYGYFKNNVLDAYENEVGEIEGLTRAGRSHLKQVHTLSSAWKEIDTEFVSSFEPPEYFYDKVLFVEKHGVAKDIAEAGLGDLYDMAIVGAPGFGSLADRRLLRILAEEDYKILLLHDLDVNGMSILANVQDGNHRMAGVEVEVLDLGLRLADVPALDLKVRQEGGTGFLGEEATRQKALPTTIDAYLTAAERELLTGTPRNAKVWEYKRYELNEIPAAMRVPFVEEKLEAAGLRKKVMPPESYLVRGRRRCASRT